MADVESIDSLSNTELRMKCIEYNLPNVPVTDSSRKVLIKKLREVMIKGKDGAAKETTTKSSSRRETVHVSKTAESFSNEPLSLSQPAKNRRTVAAVAPAFTKDDTSVPTSIPISTRRRSVQKEPEAKPVKSSAKVKSTPTIVIEDDEEDNDLLAAVENAEKESTSSAPIETITSRRKSRSVSVPKAIEVASIPVSKKRAMTPLVEEPFVKEQTMQSQPKDVQTVSVSNNNAPTQKSFQPTISSVTSTFTQPAPKIPVDMTGNWYGVYDKEQTNQTESKMGFEKSTSRYSALHGTTSTDYSSPAMRYSVAGVATTSYRSKYSAEEILNEQSDSDLNDGLQSPYVSKFVRNLEREKANARSAGKSGGLYKRHTISKYDSIRGRRSENEPTIGQLVRDLNRRYKVDIIIIVLVLFFLSILAYVWLKAM